MPPLYRIGTSGWLYPHWSGIFYPDKLPKRQWFSFYASNFDTVEVNATFYRLPTVKTFDDWRQQAPEGFCYTLKVSRLITHLKRLKDCEQPLTTFFERARQLGDRLGPLFYQLPPNLHRNDALLQDFLKLLPSEYSHVFEFRHTSWFDEAVLEELRAHNIAFCVHDYGDLKPPVVRTAEVAYIRLHGTTGRYSGSYSHEQLADWAKNLRRLARGASSAYVYFNNDIGGHAVENAKEIAQLLGVESD